MVIFKYIIHTYMRVCVYKTNASVTTNNNTNSMQLFMMYICMYVDYAA